MIGVIPINVFTVLIYAVGAGAALIGRWFRHDPGNSTFMGAPSLLVKAVERYLEQLISLGLEARLVLVGDNRISRLMITRFRVL
jgi:hypothetical protein